MSMMGWYIFVWQLLYVSFMGFSHVQGGDKFPQEDFTSIEPTRLVSSEAMDALREGSGASQEAKSVIFVVMGSCAKKIRMYNLDRTWCDIEHHSGVECWVYVDCEIINAPSVRSLRLIPPSEYLELEGAVAHAPRMNCCNQSNKNNENCPGSSRANQLSSLAAQYRYLPAIQHAVSKNKARFKDGGASWLVVVDDGTWVTMPRLLDVLSRYKPGVNVQLGDFVIAPTYNETHWKRPLACGGAGTILSAAAAVTVDWNKCMRLFHNSCMQSDWMIGRCLNEYPEILPDLSFSCGACSRDTVYDSVQTNRIEDLAMNRKCAFSHVTSEIPFLDISSDKNKPTRLSWITHVIASSATLHLKGSIWDIFKFHCLGNSTKSHGVTSLPKTMLIGAMKSGTTAMWDRLMYDTAKVNSHSNSSMNGGRAALFCLPNASNMLGT